MINVLKRITKEAWDLLKYMLAAAIGGAVVEVLSWWMPRALAILVFLIAYFGIWYFWWKKD